MVSKHELREKEFNRLLLESVDKAFASLGDSPKQSIYFHLKKQFGLKKREIPEKIDKCGLALESIFGPGACFLGVQIMKYLHAKTSSILEWQETENLSFIKYITEGKRSFLAKVEENIRSVVFEPEETPRIHVVHAQTAQGRRESD